MNAADAALSRAMGLVHGWTDAAGAWTRWSGALQVLPRGLAR
ncbi:MAG: hypothetical protein ACYCVD_13500 [Desulfitobacteriaceae bacterium]